MNTVPLTPVANQAVTISLNAQDCQINVYQKRTGVFLDLYVANVLVIAGVSCQSGRLMILSSYLGFLGDLMFIDNQGEEVPFYTGLGDRWTLLYIATEDFPAGSLYS